jgi:hypothetical protein
VPRTTAMAPDSRRCVTSSPHAFLGHHLVNVNTWRSSCEKRCQAKSMSGAVDRVGGRDIYTPRRSAFSSNLRRRRSIRGPTADTALPDRRSIQSAGHLATDPNVWTAMSACQSLAFFHRSAVRAPRPDHRPRGPIARRRAASEPASAPPAPTQSHGSRHAGSRQPGAGPPVMRPRIAGGRLPVDLRMRPLLSLAPIRPPILPCYTDRLIIGNTIGIDTLS